MSLGAAHSTGAVITTSNGWRIEHTPDGKVIMNKRIEKTISNYNTYGPFYGFHTQIDFPFALKIDYQSHTSWKIGSGFAVAAGNLGRTTTGFNAYGMGTAGDSMACTLDILVIGEQA